MRRKVPFRVPIHFHQNNPKYQQFTHTHTHNGTYYNRQYKISYLNSFPSFKMSQRLPAQKLQHKNLPLWLVFYRSAGNRRQRFDDFTPKHNPKIRRIPSGVNRSLHRLGPRLPPPFIFFFPPAAHECAVRLGSQRLDQGWGFVRGW